MNGRTQTRGFVFIVDVLVLEMQMARGCASLDEYLIKMSVRCWQVSSWNDLFAVPTSSWIPLCKKRLGPKYVQLPSGTNPAKPLASNVYSKFFHFDGLGMPPAMLHVWLSVRPFRTLLLKYWIYIYNPKDCSANCSPSLWNIQPRIWVRPPPHAPSTSIQQKV